MKLFVLICILGLLSSAFGQKEDAKKDARKERKEARVEAKELNELGKHSWPWQSWPRCKRFKPGEFAWRPCVECCPLGYYCTHELDFGPNPIFYWRKWCCELEPCCNVT